MKVAYKIGIGAAIAIGAAAGIWQLYKREKRAVNSRNSKKIAEDTALLNQEVLSNGEELNKVNNDAELDFPTQLIHQIWKGAIEDDFLKSLPIYRGNFLYGGKSAEGEAWMDAVNNGSIQNNTVHLLQVQERIEGQPGVALKVMIRMKPRMGRTQPGVKSYKDMLAEYVRNFWETEGINTKVPGVYSTGYYTSFEETKDPDGDTLYAERYYECPKSVIDTYASSDEVKNGLSIMASRFYGPDKLKWIEADMPKLHEAGIPAYHTWVDFHSYVCVNIPLRIGNRRTTFDIPKASRFISGLLEQTVVYDQSTSGVGETMKCAIFHPNGNLSQVIDPEHKDRETGFMSVYNAYEEEPEDE